MSIDLVNDALIAWRKKALERFQTLGLPKAKQDGFHYLSSGAFAWPAPASHSRVEKSRLQEKLMCDSHLVFVDGHYDPTLSQMPAGIVCIPLEAALKSYGLFLQNRWTKLYKEERDPLFALNGAQHGSGAFLYVPPNQAFGPIQVHHVLTGSSLASPRLQITLGKGAELNLIQTFQSFSEMTYCNGVMDALLEAGAGLRLTDAVLAPQEARHFFSLRAALKRDASCNVFHATSGARAVRFSAHLELTEENSSAKLETIGLLSGEKQAHVNARIEHAAPHTQSHQKIKMVLSDTSRSSFEGKIYVHPEAQKTEAYQSNQNLLLGDGASAHTKPNLEIFADDVKASHGATISQIDEEAEFYLRSRGIDPKSARSLLVEGFCRELLDPLEPQALKDELLAAMKQALR